MSAPPELATIEAALDPWLELRPLKKALDLLLMAVTGPLLPTSWDELAAALSSAVKRFGVTPPALSETDSSNALLGEDVFETDGVLSSGAAALTFLDGPKNEVMSRLDMWNENGMGF